MRTRGKALLGLGVFIGLSLLALILFPVLFADRITAHAKAEIGEAVNAQVDWRDAGLTFLRNFPNLTLRLEDLTVRGMNRFEGDTLAAIGNFRVVLDVRSVLFGDQIVIRSIELNELALHLIVLQDGAANWDIVKPKPGEVGASERAGFNLGLRALNVHGARIVFDNRKAGLFASLDGLEHSLRGDFTQERFNIDTRTQSDEVTVRFAGISYLDRVALDVTADIDADLANQRFTFGENQVRLNDLLLNFSGHVAKAGDDLELDVQFDSPSNNFRSVLSLVPAIYARDFASLRTDGVVSVGGRMTGRYGESAFPALALHAKVDSASFQYPDLPLPARDIFLDLAIDNPGGSADSTVVNLRRFQATIGGDAVRATMALRTPISDPDVDLAINGTLDLAAASRTLELEGFEELAGIVNADVAVHARRSAIDSQQYDRIVARGDVGAKGVALRTARLPHRVAIDELALRFSPRTAELRSLRGAVGSSDLRMTGSLENLIGFALRGGELSGRATFDSDRFDLNEWKSDRDSLTVIPVPPRVDLALTAAIAQLKYGRMEMTGARGVVRVKDQRLTIDSLRMNALGGQFRVAGFYETTNPAKPTFDVDVAITDADVPEAFRALTTVQLLAPVARYAQGRFSTGLRLIGALNGDMTPIFTGLDGRGSLETSQLVLREFPPMDRLADALKSRHLRNPALRAIRSAVEIREGRLFVRPFDVAIGSTTMTVGGWNGIDQSLGYDIVLALPRSALEDDARQVVNDLFVRAGGAGLDTMSVMRLGVRLTGTITNPSITLDAGRGVATARQALDRAARETVERVTQTVEERVDSAKLEARRKAEAEAQRLVQEAEQRAAAIREEAQRLAEAVRKEGNERADTLLARATSPIARVAARPAADRLRREADTRAEQILREADSRANDLVAEARRKADELIRSAGEG
ncbi:MAG: AsmA-like C-terminal region-containing protein [Longimicrobiales bacterium]